MYVWIVTVANWPWATEPSTVAVCRDETTARKAVEDHAQVRELEIYLDDWAVVERDGQVVSVALEGDECEVVATRWEVKAEVETPKRRKRKLHEPLFMD